VPESRKVLQHCAMDCGGVLEPKKPWASSGCSVLTLCVSGGVSLDRPPPGETFWSLLGGRGGWLQGLTRGPRSLRALGGRGKLYLLVSCPGRDPVGGAVRKAAPRERRRGAHEHR
jgi:hypothetical protein